MTTIAYRDGVLVADSYASDDATVMQVVKSARMPNGDVAGGAGDLGQVAQALAWLQSGTGDPPDIDQSGILFTSDGVPHLASGRWPGVRVKGFVAIGSGAQGAMTAMKLGHSAESAVAAVCGIDPCSGGELDVLPVTYKPKAKRKK